jgi:hypothetical protein
MRRRCYVTRNIDDVIRRLFNLRGEKRRIDCADNLACAPYMKAGLGRDFKTVINDMHYCRELRNQYAHCQWYGTSQDGFAFVNLEEVSKLNTAILPLETHRRPVDAALLQQQETFFKYVQKYFWHITGEYQTRVNGQHRHVWLRPAVVAQRLTENELSDFSRLWHDGCGKAIIGAQDVDRNHSPEV